MTRFKFGKEWMREKAELEAGADIGVGAGDIHPVTFNEWLEIFDELYSHETGDWRSKPYSHNFEGPLHWYFAEGWTPAKTLFVEYGIGDPEAANDAW